jgi:hypothetical protein
MIGQWSLGGKRDEYLDEHQAGEAFGTLHQCLQGMLDSRANFLGTLQPYILYLWEYLNLHNPLKMLFQ